MTGRLSLDSAQAILAGALAGPRSAPDRPIAVAVCDAGGHILALAREAAAPPLLAHIAEAKAHTCIVYGKTPASLAPVADDYPTWFHGISRVAETRMGLPLIGSKGGRFIRAADGSVLGAVGVAGETGDKDEELAERGITGAGLTSD